MCAGVVLAQMPVVETHVNMGRRLLGSTHERGVQDTIYEFVELPFQMSHHFECATQEVHSALPLAACIYRPTPGVRAALA